MYGVVVMHANDTLMTIGEVARMVDVATSTLRYYERQGLIQPQSRSRAGYRMYDALAVERLRFVRAAQAVGFTLDDIRALLELDEQSDRERVQAMIEERIADIDARLADLNRVRATLGSALQRCRGSGKCCAVVTGLKQESRKRS